ncbi:MAG: PHP domain-containing protein [Acholeplasmataceae bacterium]|jgi:histidinol-phosphatase (PHP family)
MTKYQKHKANYHTHTWLCRHASGSVIDYAKEAVKHGHTVMGMTDHAPFDMLARYGSQRMSWDEYHNIYLPDLEDAIEYGKKHGLTIYKGLEIEYYDGYDNHYQRLLEDLDYLILGQHYLKRKNGILSVYDLKTLDEIIEYRDEVIKALRTGYFSLLCHPEVCFWRIKNPTDEMYEALRPMIKECVKLNIPIEINANGIRRAFLEQKLDPYNYNNYRYPKPKFWQMVAEEGGVGLVASDAHDPKVLHDFAIEIAYQFAKDLKVNVITELEFKDNKYRKR